ncbi:hypothetical protein STEG23_007662 [Scotinomys teguina]
MLSERVVEVIDSPPSLYSGLKAWSTIVNPEFDLVDFDLPCDQIKGMCCYGSRLSSDLQGASSSREGNLVELTSAARRNSRVMEAAMKSSNEELVSDVCPDDIGSLTTPHVSVFSNDCGELDSGNCPGAPD